MISSLKAMVIIFWSPLGFPVIQALPPKVTFTSEFCVDTVLPYIVTTKRADDPGRWLVLHMDSASAYRARLPEIWKKTELQRVLIRHSRRTLRPLVSISSVY
jgi:hypothetical protein